MQNKEMKLLRMSKLVLIATIYASMLLVPHVYAGGPRLDYDEAYEDVQGAPECWIDGYDAGFAGKYDRQRADECNQIEGDQYNAAWGYGCDYAGYTEEECDDIKGRNVSLIHEDLKEENTSKCSDDGYADGRNNLFDHNRNRGCDDYGRSYYGFIAGCISVKNNTEESCEKLTIR